MKPAIKVVLLVRVSSKRQDTDRQENDLREEAARRGWEVTGVIEETISGSVDADAREGLEKVLALAQSRKIQKVMVHEITRIARRPSIIHAFLEELTAFGVSLYWHMQGMETLTPDGKQNHMANLMVAILAGLAKNETDILAERIKSGMENARRKGVPIGRPAGDWDSEKVLQRHAAAVNEIKTHPELSNRRLALLGGVSENTILKLKKLLAA